MAKKTKRVEKFLPDELLMPSMPNPGTMGTGGRILRIREDFNSVNDLMANLVEYYRAFDLLHKKIWPSLKIDFKREYTDDYPKIVSLTFKKVYEIGAAYIEHMHDTLARMNNVVQFPNFKSYVDFLDDAVNNGYSYSPKDLFKVPSILAKIYSKYSVDIGAVVATIIYSEKHIEMRDTLLDWIKIAKKTRLYKAGSKLPVRTKLLRHRKSTPSSIVTLREFMDKYCDARGVDIESKVPTLYDADRNGKITLPKKQNNWSRGKTKLFLAEDLKENWDTYKKALPNLPNIKQ